MNATTCPAAGTQLGSTADVPLDGLPPDEATPLDVAAEDDCPPTEDAPKSSELDALGDRDNPEVSVPCDEDKDAWVPDGSMEVEGTPVTKLDATDCPLPPERLAAFDAPDANAKDDAWATKDEVPTEETMDEVPREPPDPADDICDGTEPSLLPCGAALQTPATQVSWRLQSAVLLHRLSESPVSGLRVHAVPSPSDRHARKQTGPTNQGVLLRNIPGS